MTIFYADQTVESHCPSIFLAGPTPRSLEVTSWRPNAIKLLREARFEGSVLIPERRDWQTPFDYMHQVEWEFANLEACTVIAFWVPRQLPAMPGLTTNVEFGRYVASGRCVYGRPDGAPHTGYLDWLYKKMTGCEPCSTLNRTILDAIKRCQPEALARE